MGNSAPTLDTSGVITEEVYAAPDAAMPDQITATPAAKTPDQEKPKGDAPASGEAPGTSANDATAKRRDPQKRIDQLTRRLREAERREAYERGRREALEQVSTRSAGAAAQEAPKPKAEDFATTEEFAESLADWKLRQKEQPSAQRKSEPKAGSEETPREAPRAPTESERKSYESAKAKYPDLDDVLFDADLPWTRHMADAVSEEPNAAEILYHLGQDEAELERIAKLSPKQQEREVWRFAEKLNAKLAESSTPGDPDKDAGSKADTETDDDTDAGDDGGAGDEPRARQQPRAQVSKAAPVPSTLSGRGGAPSKSLEVLAETDFDAFDAEMTKREKARRR